MRQSTCISKGVRSVPFRGCKKMAHTQFRNAQTVKQQRAIAVAPIGIIPRRLTVPSLVETQHIAAPQTSNHKSQECFGRETKDGTENVNEMARFQLKSIRNQTPEPSKYLAPKLTLINLGSLPQRMPKRCPFLVSARSPDAPLKSVAVTPERRNYRFDLALSD